MNERIKELAEQAKLIKFNFGEQGGYTTIEAVSDLNNLERFAKLVRQDEREACAKLCEQIIKESQIDYKESEFEKQQRLLCLKMIKIPMINAAAAIRGRTE